MSSDFDLDELEEKEGGSGLRRKLEETLAQNRKLTAEYASLAAKELIRENGWSLVKPEDLAGVSPEELATKAEELQVERLEQRRSVARDMLAQRGLEGRELEAAVDEFLAPPEKKPAQDSGWDDVIRIGRGGAPVPATDESKLHGRQAIAHALTKKS